MTFLAPIFLVAAAAASLVVVGLHFLVTRPPPLVAFPTARFIPRSTIIVTSLARRPQDILLLVLRVLALMLIGAAFARPVLVPRHRAIARILLADRGWSVASIADVRDSLGAIYQPGDRLVLVDSVAREVVSVTADSIATMEPVHASAALSPALIVARRLAAVLRMEADSVDLVLISAMDREGWDGATGSLRRTWPGRIRLVTVAARRDSTLGPGVLVRAAGDDPIRSALALTGGSVSSGEGVRLLRDSLARADSAWAEQGGTVVIWPEAQGAVRDTSNAVVTRAGALVFPFPRPSPIGRQDGIVQGRWVDGEPAVLERTVGKGCLRTVAVPVTARGDFVLRPDFLRFLRETLRPCVANRSVVPLDATDRATLQGGPHLADRAQLAPPEAPDSPLVPWLFGLAIGLMLLELLLRNRPQPEGTA